MKRAWQAEIRPAGNRDGMAARGGPVWDGGRGSRSNTDRRGPLRKSCFEYDSQKTPLVTPAESLPFLTRDNTPPNRPRTVSLNTSLPLSRTLRVGTPGQANGVDGVYGTQEEQGAAGARLHAAGSRR